jgi:hypothetical protein
MKQCAKSLKESPRSTSHLISTSIVPRRPEWALLHCFISIQMRN